MTEQEVCIAATGLYTPPHVISNAELVDSFNRYVEKFNQDHASDIDAGEMQALQPSSEEFIVKASGIKSRYVMDKAGILDPERMCPYLPERDNEQASVQCDMAVAAARQALDKAGLQAADVDQVLVACSNMQRAYPAMAVEVQAALGIDGFAFDINVACSSATFGIQTAVDAVCSGQAGVVLMVNPEICSGHLDFADRDSHFIFGDACTAALVCHRERAPSGSFRILGTRLRTSYSNNIRNNFGFLNRADERGVGRPDKLFKQQGRKVFKEVCPMVAEHIVEHLEVLGLTRDRIQRLWLHQANLSMNQLVSKKVLGRDPEALEAPVILDRYANTSSAGSVIAFHLHSDDLQPHDIGVICSFGAGYSVGSVVLEKLS